jgi:SlyX protein
VSEAELSARIEALEVRITYQDRTIEDLNTSVTAQWRQIDDLKKQLARMTDRLSEVEANAPPGEPDPPPQHY